MKYVPSLSFHVASCIILYAASFNYFKELTLTRIIQDVQLKSGPYFDMSNLFTKIYNMLYFTTNLCLQ
jgi:hypothetical protein